MSHKKPSLVYMTSSISVSESSPPPWTSWAIVLILTGIFMRLGSIDAPLVSDELVNASIWAQMPYDKIPTNYQFPNNHIFHTLLMGLILKTFGAHPVWLRLPALLCGSFSLFLVYRLAFRITNNQMVAYGALALMATATTPVFYSTHARGYSLLIVFTLLTIGSLLPFFQSHRNFYPQNSQTFSLKTAGGLSFLWTLGTWTIPTFVFFEGALFLLFFILVSTSPSSERLPLMQVLTFLLIALVLFYVQYFIIIAPEMLKSAKSNAASVSFASFLPQLLSEWTRPWDAFRWLFVLLALLGARTMASNNGRQTAALAGLFFLPLIMACLAPLLGFMNQPPHPRVFIFLSPLFYIAVVQGTWFLFDEIQSTRQVTKENTARIVIQRTSFGILFLIVITWGIQDLIFRVIPDQQAREDHQKAQKYIKNLGPRDLVLISNKQHLWFYLYGANEMRKRVDRILDDGQLDTIYFLVRLNQDSADAEWVKGPYGKSLWLKGFSIFKPHSQPARKILIPENILERSDPVGSIHFFRVSSKALRPLIRTPFPSESMRWRVVSLPPTPLQRTQPSKNLSFKFQNSIFIFDKQPLPSENDVFSMDLFLVRTQIPPSAWTLFSNGRQEGQGVVFNPTWRGNDWVMDHPYGPHIFQRPWLSWIFLSFPNPAQPILTVQMGKNEGEGQIGGWVAYRLQGISKREE